MNNPFNMVYTTMFDMLANREGIKELVRFGNMVRFDSKEDRSPVKLNIASADLPELILLINGINDVSLYSSSSTSRVVRSYSWMISTGDFRLNEFLQPIEWEVFTGMLDWCTELTSLKWCDKSFVKRVEFTDASNGFSDVEANRGIQGWSAIWSCEVEMHFNTKDLRNGCS